MADKTVKLRAPIKAQGQELQELTFREPTGVDLAAIGMPFTVGQDGGLNIATAPMARMMARLANIPPSSIGQLSAPDWMAAAMEVLGFFATETPQTS
jgi:hypothetical protein